MYVSDRALPPEEVTVNTIESLLRIPTLASGRTEEQLVASYGGEDGLVTDPDFLPSVSSLFPDPNQPPASAPPEVTWRRVSGTLYFPTGKTARLLQGVLDSSSFLGALGAVAAARGGELLLDLIVSDDAAPQGAYTFQFFKHGCWQAVVVDNYLPCLADQERLAFACSAVVGELWPSLLEKAYAKVHGSYYALEGLPLHETLVDLTGGVGFKLKLDSQRGRQAVAEGALWLDLQAWLGAGSVIACVAKRRAPARQQFRPDAVDHDTGLATAADGEGPSGEGSGGSGSGLGSGSGRRGSGEDPYGNEDGLGSGSGSDSSYGLLRGQAYTLLEARVVPGAGGSSSGHAGHAGDGVRLVRLHCAWPQGVWRGPWSTGSPEWEQPAMGPHLDSFAATWEDEATFWMPYEAFTAFFNRLHVCRMFPPTWHQLTLHCGWQGPSAGGPYYAPPLEPSFPSARANGNGIANGQFAPVANGGARGGAASTANGQPSTAGPALSSTWCCNPQFRLTVKRAAEVVVCLGQQDPTVGARVHIPKRHRKRSIGLQVLKVPLDSLGRRWEAKPGELVASLAPSAAREVCASFRASPDFAYVVVPHAGRAGEEGAFVLRTLASSPLEVEQLPAPLCLVVGGHWSGFLAGGGRSHPSWGSNPQYMISAAHQGQVVASISRLDLKYAILKAPRDPSLDLDLTLCAPDSRGPDGPGRRTAVRDSEVLAASSLAASGAPSNEEAVLSVTLEPETPYLLVPSLATPGVEAPYELRLMSAVPLELVPLPEMQSVQLAGEWTPESAGGCNVNPLWRRNPKFHICLNSFGRVRITLSRSRPPRIPHPVDDMLGIYILRAAGPEGEIKGDPKRAVVAESTFVPQPDTTAEYELNGGCHYVIMPCTYGPGRTGRFTLAVSSATAFTFRSLQQLH
ncbi:hypothetical protein HYH03_006480 [Edaphochlamys debaryana]|uniref:Calpain catalytic domain-containing protein n=1 Tax=Edaphochlamys debaryana TaxID=47281 RepID=A0A836C151_9CHLO|nr:hypothetical protein HYH03_006480 [Edaphochlamys debaryana]|eukprot:KAG2495537.1 hypothetical protein HYH03_006480 [Edaphochlamys debaryana]